MNAPFGERPELFEAILRSSADGVVVFSASGERIYVNDAGAQLSGFASAAEMLAAPPELLAERFSLFHEDGTPLSPSELPSRRILAGEPTPEPTLVRFRQADDGRDRISEIRALPIRDPDGALTAVVSYFRDVTSERRFGQRQQLAADVGAILAGSLDFEATLQAIASSAVPELADWCYVDLVDDDGTIVRAATAHVDPAQAELLAGLSRRWPTERQSLGAGQVVSSGEPSLVPEVSSDVLERVAQDEEHLRALRELGLTSYLAVPIRSGDRVLGVVSFVTSDSRRRYDENDVVLAQDIAARAAGALRNAQLYQEAQRTSALLDSLYDGAPIGLGFWDADLHYVRVNHALAQINDRSPEDHVGKTFAEVIPQLSHVVEPVARGVLERREAVVAMQMTGGTPDEPEAERHWLASYYPVLAPDGEVLGVGAVIEEITERRRAEQRTELQHAVTRVLSDSETVSDGVPRVLETLCASRRWDVAAYWPVDPDEPRVTWSRPGVQLDGFVATTRRSALSADDVTGRVAASGRAEWLPDLSGARFARAPVAAAEGLRAGVAFPILIEGEVAGVLEAYSRSSLPEDPELLQSLVALGGQLGQFLGRKRAEQERLSLLQRERLARAEAEDAVLTLRKLERVSEVALAHSALHDLLGALLERIVEVLDADTASILLLDDDDHLSVRATTGLEAQMGNAVRIPLGRGLAGSVAASKQPLVVPDLSEVELVSPVLRERGINSLVAIPLIAEERVIGVVHAGSEAFAHFSGKDARLLELIADRIALAIDHAALSDATTVAQDRLQFLSEASVVLSSSLDLDLTLQRAARLAVARFADAAIVDLVDGDRIARVVIEIAEPRLSGAIRDGLLANPPSPDDLGGSAKVIRTGEPEILLDLDVDPGPLVDVTRGRPQIQATVDLLEPRSLVYMPLKARDQVLGVLALIRTTESFDERDVDTVRELAARAAVAVDNAYLYREAERGRERLEFLAEASALLGSTLDVELTLEQLGSLIAGRIADWCAIHLVEPSGQIRLVSAANADPALAEGARAEVAALGPGREPPAAVAQVLAGGEPILFTEPAWLPEDSPERAAGVHTGLIVPLVARGHPIGAISLVRAETAETYTQADLELAADIARRAAIALDNARLFHEAQERAQAARVLDSVGDGVFLVDRLGVVRTWNRAAAAATSLAPAEVIDQPALTAIPGWAAVVGRVPVALESSAAPRAESLPLDLGERELWLSLHGVTVPDGTVYAFRDLTEERALESMRTEFVSTVSHELRTPLAAIYGAAMTLRRSDVALDDDQRARLLDVVSAEADRLARTVNDILWASRLDAGSLHVSIESCDPLALAEDVVAAQRAHLDDRHELVLTSEDDLPKVASDPDKVGRVLINLVDNAVKYSPDGGRIDVRLRQTAGHVRFSIRDEGLGIPLAEQRRIFEKFYRLDPNMNRGVGGTGLGLYICRELVRRMGGRIWVESAGLGAGTTFNIELPVAGELATHLT